LYTGGANVTASSFGLIMTNGAFYESDTNAKVDGVLLTRYNFPGGASGAKVNVDFTSTFQPDQIASGNYFRGSLQPGSHAPSGTTNAMAWYDQTNALRLDYNLSTANQWTVNPANSILELNGNATGSFSPTLELNDVPNGGVNWGFYSLSGFFGITNFSSGNFEGPFQVNSSQFQLAAAIIFGWSSLPTFADTLDTGFSRLAAGSVALGNGTAGDKTGSLTLATIIKGGTVPTGTTGSCSATSFVGGATAGKFTAPLCAAGTIILSALPAAPNGYTCNAQDQTTVADLLQQTASTVSSVTFKATTVLNDVVVFQCTGW
jgi:hypothetical protein